MKNTLLVFSLFLTTTVALAQEKNTHPNIAIKWAPTGLFLGSISLQAEYNFGKNSLTAKLGMPVSAHHIFQYDGKNADFNMKATSFLAGYRTYLSKMHMRGLYFEPYFKYVHQTSEGTGDGTLTGEPVVMNFTNDFNSIGIGAQLGAQFILWKRLVIDLFFFGPEINSATNNFKSVETTNSIPWTNMQANEAEQDIRNFINKFPFIRNKANVMVDKENKTVTVDYNGALPGYRIGVSFGIAF
jgi:hypothetical protein